jgi:hypothetical protein
MRSCKCAARGSRREHGCLIWGGPVDPLRRPYMHLPMLQCLEKQSLSSPHSALGGQLGAQIGGAQTFATHRCEPQSVLAPHGVPSAQG